MELVALLCAALLSGTFLVAAIGKFLDPDGTRQAIIDFGLHPSLVAHHGVYALPATEVIVAILLLLPATSVGGGVGALLLLISFSAAISWNLARGRQPDCHCFGQARSAPISALTLIRNLLLTCLALTVVMSGGISPEESFGWWSQTAMPIRVLIATTTAMLAGIGFLVYLVFRLSQDVRELRDQAPTNDMTAQTMGLSHGTRAPSFSLPDIEGGMVSLDELLAREKPVLLVFSSPDCGPCNDLFPDVSKWQSAYAGSVTVAVLATGSMESNRAKADEHGIRVLLLQQEGEPGRTYQATATPSAVLLEPDGTVAIGLAAGPDAIRNVFNDLISRHVSQLWESATGEEVALLANVATIGDQIPELELMDLRGRVRSTAELKEERIVLILWSPSCGYCQDMLSDLRKLERLKSIPRLVFITNGTGANNVTQRLRSLMLVDDSFALGRALGATGTPSAILLERGTITSRISVGSAGVLALIEESRYRNREGSGVS